MNFRANISIGYSSKREAIFSFSFFRLFPAHWVHLPLNESVQASAQGQEESERRFLGCCMLGLTLGRRRAADPMREAFAQSGMDFSAHRRRQDRYGGTQLELRENAT